MEENPDTIGVFTSARSLQPDISNTTVCEAAEDSVIINKNNETVIATSIPNDQDQHTEESIDHSDDLFPTEPSIDDFFVPSSSPSAELFHNISSSESHSADNASLFSENESTSSSDKSDDMPILNRAPDCCLPLPKLEPSGNHFIMFSPHIRPGDAPRPYPNSYRDTWDDSHVRFPCSPQSKYTVKNLFGEERYVSRWELICQSLRSDIGSSKDLENAIMKYNGKWNFQGLHAFINKHWTEAERDHFFETMLPAMVEMALDLPNICTRPMPLLKAGINRSITLSQKQIGCLLLNAFFCTFPRRALPRRHNKLRWISQYANYPDINFNRLFIGTKNEIPSRNAEKLKCIFNYFRRIISQEPTGTVTFHRQYVKVDKIPVWHASTHGIRTAVIKSSGLIEIDGQGMLQMDFANKFVGGGVLGQGCVQEEIRFIICPELIVSRLFVECLDKTEVLIVNGVEQYNKYSGYADSFKWEGDFKDETPRDSWGRCYTQVVAMDALNFIQPYDQFKVECLKRELDKAFSGFYEDAPPAHLRAVATGNWGCGAFKGNPNLKFLIQLMAASEAGRSLVYFTFGNKKLKAEMKKMYNFLNDKNLAIGDIWRLLVKYNDDTSSLLESRPNLYDFIYSQFAFRKECSIKQNNGDCNDEFLDDSDMNELIKLVEDPAVCGSSIKMEHGT